MRRFYLHKRGKVFYAELIDPQTGRKLPARSTGTPDHDGAVLIVADWLKNGLPAGRGRERRPLPETFTLVRLLDSLRSSPLSAEDAAKIADILKARGLLVSAVVTGVPGAELFNAYLTRFWTYEGSPYVNDLHSVERRMGRTHCAESLGRVAKYWKPYFKGRYLAEIERADLKAFRLHLADPELGLSATTRNRILTVGTTALGWAFDNDLINEDPTIGVTAYATKLKKRGVLSPEEAAAIFRLEWKDERVKLGNRVAATTGLRVGEILALRREDIAEAWLWVRHSYSLRDGLKTTKTGTERRAPLLPEIRVQLLELADQNPEGFIFAKIGENVPMHSNAMLYGLQDALLRLSLGEKYATATAEEIEKAEAKWKARNVLVHSWRHFYAARMADRLDARKVMLSTGHANGAVFAAYADHALDSDFAEVGAVAVEVFKNILPLGNVRGA
jgi:integrase